jgi:hypothetical protein
MRAITENEFRFISGGEWGGGGQRGRELGSLNASTDPNGDQIDCDVFVWTCFARDAGGFADAIADIATAIWDGIFTVVDILACHAFPAELRDPLIDFLGIENPCGQ